MAKYRVTLKNGNKSVVDADSADQAKAIVRKRLTERGVLPKHDYLAPKSAKKVGE